MPSHELDTPAIAAAIAAHLPNWSLKPPAPDDTKMWATLVGPNGAELSFYDERNGKLRVSPRWQQDGGRTYPTDHYLKTNSPDAEKPASVQVTATREPATLARDIHRRIIAAYLPIYELGRKQKAEDDAYEAKVEAAAVEVADILQDDTYREGDRTIGRYVYRPGHEGGTNNSVDTNHVEVRVNSPTSFELELSSLDLDTLKKILALFPKLPREVRTL